MLAYHLSCFRLYYKYPVIFAIIWKVGHLEYLCSMKDGKISYFIKQSFFAVLWKSFLWHSHWKKVNIENLLMKQLESKVIDLNVSDEGHVKAY